MIGDWAFNLRTRWMTCAIIALLAFYAIRINGVDFLPFFIDEAIVVNIGERIPQTGILLDVWRADR